MVDFLHDIPDDQLSILDNKYVIAVVGSRDYTDESHIFNNLTGLINALINYKEIDSWSSVLIISGKARGVDKIGWKYAKVNSLTDVNILADWDKYGNSAGMKRNPNIIKHADRVLAFRLNNSSGTTNSINHARSLHIPTHVIDV